MNRRNKWTVVGISGMTNAGKTTIAQKIKEIFPDSVHIKQDDYYLPESDPRHKWVPELGHINWELLSAFNMNKMVKEIKNILKSEPPIPSLLMIDGIMIFNDTRIPALCDFKFFIDLDYDTCLARRKKRTYDPPDVEGYFEEIVWPQTVKNRKEAFTLNKDIYVLNGAKAPDDNLENVLRRINTNFPKTN